MAKAHHGERSDAQRNRRGVLEAADRLFAERGTTVTLVEIASEAGVGTGTVYRHFPTKDALLATVLDRRLALIVDHASHAAADVDPAAAFFDYLRYLTDQALRNRAVCEALATRGDWQRPEKLDGGCVLDGPLATLLERAQRAGAVRGDVDYEDLRTMLSGCVGMAGPPERVRRLAAITWDGLRAERNTDGRNETRPSATVRNETFVTERSCPVCDDPVAHAGTGRPPKFCSAACRQKAFRDKRRAAA